MTGPDAPVVEGFEPFAFTHDGSTRSVYRGGTGPAVVVMHELPGIVPEVSRFARRVRDRGFSVYLPWLFGTPNRAVSVPYLASEVAKVCIRREFDMLAADASSPIVDWLRGLCRHAHAEAGGPGVGAVGMCITGSFALALMVDPSVIAPVMSQPSLPLPLGRARKRGLHLSPADLAMVKRRARAEGIHVLALRFTTDPLCPRERFQRLREELDDRFEGIEIDSGWGNAGGNNVTAHSVLTVDLVDRPGHPTHDALERVLALLDERLKPHS